ncbi:50S ribosomal protein L30 [Smithella sp. SC_K08D17]|nr:50S ribosomal protein L30 [Smithella sp. D17]KIE17967.1 50S ribosomal protein L30 [Smithella sp. SC_K08D17]MDD5344375.1 50S ribosomal protein L30 [Smithella sp.]MDD5524301.1 50S ribosomal protein L30 [Smithella sp.]PKN37612.1 MAG: 50S ribosomal protein L30 [Deltaproteobacteria bacterium HGW-Deltaproteobacteria-2]
MAKMLKIKKIRSVIGRPEKQRKILKGMGLNKLNSTVTLVDTPQVRGMVNKVIHLVSMEESEE